MKRVSIHFFLAMVALLFAPLSANAQKNNVLFIVDFSGSMKEPAGSETKIAAAKKAFRETMNAIPASTNIGLMAFGQRRAKDCTDIELLSPLGQRTAKELAGSIDNFEPKGETPIAASLLQAKDVFANQKSENNSIVLITDGREECNGNVCEAAEALKASGIGVKVHIVGLGHNDSDRKAVECITKISGGIYVAANDAKTLTDALQPFTRVQTCGPAKRPNDMREWIDSGVVKITVQEIVNDHYFGQNTYRMILSVENCSGAGLGISFGDQSGWSVGTCPTNVESISGVNWVKWENMDEYKKWRTEPNPSQRLQWFPAGKKISGIIKFQTTNCETKESSITANLRVFLADDKNTAYVPFSVENIPFRRP
jgi:hypothetical protein